MGDSLKLFKDKRHRSSSSIAGVALDGTFSERKLDIKASIPEGDDQFVIAEARCEDLQEKIDLVKMLKKKRKLKKRSTTRIAEQYMPEENVPFISVRTQPKKKSTMQAGKSYKDPDLVEQHRMIREQSDFNHAPKSFHPGGRSSGDGTSRREEKIDTRTPVDQTLSPTETDYFSDYERAEMQLKQRKGKSKQLTEANRSKLRRRRLFKKNNVEVYKPLNRERTVVELFNKNQDSSSVGSSQGIAQANGRVHGSSGMDHGAELRERIAAPEEGPTPRRAQSRDGIPCSVRRLRQRMRRGYEMSTVASRMKQTRAHHYIATTNATKIPFITSKSTCPSHNIGINIQQVLSGVKTQQPPSGIPTTIAHHMGLCRSQVNGTKSSHAALGSGAMDWNSMKLSRCTLKLPIHKVSYNRLLRFLREGDGLVPRFLSGVNGPHDSLPEGRHPDGERSLNGDDDAEVPSYMRATASTSGTGYHHAQSPNAI